MKMRLVLMLVGFAAAFTGDWFLAIQKSSVREVGFLSVAFFVWAMVVCPGGGYNPLTYMLSYLGRTEIRHVAYPLSHYLFILGMSAGFCSSRWCLRT